MFNVSKIQRQLLSLVVLQSLVVVGAAPSFARSHKATEATKQQTSMTDGEKLALIEGTVTVHQPETVEEQVKAPAPMSLREVESFSGASLGSFGAAGL
ncbi:MAG TPA: hypothetical protein V6C97_33365 [Oculatellaceae cyanobacterium]